MRIWANPPLVLKLVADFNDLRLNVGARSCKTSTGAVMSDQIPRLMKLVAAKDAQIEALSSRIETLEDELQDSRSEREYLLSVCAKMEQDLQEHSEHEVELESHRRQTQRVEAEALAAAERALAAEQALASSETAFAQELQELRDMFKALQERSSHSSEQGGAASQEELEALRAEMAASRSASDQAATLGALEEQHEALQDAHAALQGAHAALQREHAGLQRKVTTLQVEMDALRDQLIEKTEAELRLLTPRLTASTTTHALMVPHPVPVAMPPAGGSTDSLATAREATSHNTAPPPPTQTCLAPAAASSATVPTLPIPSLPPTAHLPDGPSYGESASKAAGGASVEHATDEADERKRWTGEVQRALQQSVSAVDADAVEKDNASVPDGGTVLLCATTPSLHGAGPHAPSEAGLLAALSGVAPFTAASDAAVPLPTRPQQRPHQPCGKTPSGAPSRLSGSTLAAAPQGWRDGDRRCEGAARRGGGAREGADGTLTPANCASTACTPLPPTRPLLQPAVGGDPPYPPAAILADPSATKWQGAHTPAPTQRGTVGARCGAYSVRGCQSAPNSAPRPGAAAEARQRQAYAHEQIRQMLLAKESALSVVANL